AGEVDLLHPGAQDVLDRTVGPVAEFAELVHRLAVAVAGQAAGSGGVVEAVDDPVGAELVQSVTQSVVGDGDLGVCGGQFTQCTGHVIGTDRTWWTSRRWSTARRLHR